METLPALPSHQVDMLISQAIDKNVSVETLEKLLAMRTQLNNEYAKEQFNIAMSNFQSKCPIIIKTKSVTTKSGMVAYKYAPIESIVSQVKELLQQCNFNYSIQTETLNQSVTVTCIVRHNSGHSEQSSMTVPFGTQTAVMSDTQVVAAAITFAKRYAFCNAFGILTGDEDNDARKQSSVKPITLAIKEQIEEIESLLIESGLPLRGILEMCKVKTLQETSYHQAQSIISRLKRYIDRISGPDEGDAVNIDNKS